MRRDLVGTEEIGPVAALEEAAAAAAVAVEGAEKYKSLLDQ